MSAATEKVLEELDAFTAQECVAFNLRLRAELIKATRVETGWARANWRVSIGAPAATPSSQTDAQAIRELAGYTLGKGAIHLTNLVPYVGLPGSGKGALGEDEVVAVAERVTAAFNAERRQAK